MMTGLGRNRVLSADIAAMSRVKTAVWVSGKPSSWRIMPVAPPSRLQRVQTGNRRMIAP